MFNFKGTSVFDFKTLGVAMATLKDREEGEELLRACEGEFGKENAPLVLGYLLGYFDDVRRPSVIRNMPRGIEHPVWGREFPSNALGDESVGVHLAMAKLYVNALASGNDVQKIAFKKQETKAPKEEKPEIVREEAEWNF